MQHSAELVCNRHSTPPMPLPAPDRRRRLSLLACWFGCVALAACGGGGDSGQPQTPPPPPPPPTTVPAVLSVPDPVGYDVDTLAAFRRINDLREKAGLGLLTQSPELDASASAHLNWELVNRALAHEEPVGSVGYTGSHGYERDLVAGYVPNWWEEGITSGYSSTRAAEVLANGLYHRAFLLKPLYLDVGIAFSPLTVPGLIFPMVVEVATPAQNSLMRNGQRMRSQTGIVSIWPADQATEVFTRNGPEFPDPMLGKSPAGIPISVAAEYWQKIEVNHFWLRVKASGLEVPCQLFTRTSDPNLVLGDDMVAIVPFGPLSRSTQYQVDFDGSVDGLGYRRTWEFTTSSVDGPT